MPVNQLCDMLSSLLLDAPPPPAEGASDGASEAVTKADFSAVAREVKGDLVPWDTLTQWLQPALPTLQPCPLADWKAEVARVAELDEQAAAELRYPPSALAASKRMLMLIPSMEHELSAEDRRRQAGEGADGKLCIDPSWGVRFGNALADMFEPRQS